MGIAATLQNPFDTLCLPLGDDDKKVVDFTHSGTQWNFISGTFFDCKKGYIFETKADGTITGIKYMLKLP